ncbi:MAG: hypothetical protein K0S15_2036 [Solirubrobacterales bacterium]|jgi:hypothetical protein|nr:hypothetical protein [Solirubrobacterales bacterium]
MEASEKPQLPLQPDVQGNASVRLVEDRIVIERMEIADRGTARVVRDQAGEGREPVETVSRAIEIGARVIESEGTAANVDFVNSQFQQHMGGLAEQLTALLETGNEELAERIATSFGADRSDSVQQQIRDLLIRANEHQRTELVRLFNAEEGANPLHDFKASITGQVAEAAQRGERQAESLREMHSREAKEMREQIALLKTEIARLTERREGDELLAEAEEAGTRKGRTFEELVHEHLEMLAAGQDDVAHHVGDTSSESGGKKGDTVLELGACHGPTLATVVVEAKNRALSKNEAWTELNAAISERDADYGVLVVAGEKKVPKGLDDLTEYQGNKMIVVLDRDDPDPLALRLVYRYVRARVLASQSDGLQVDAAGVRAASEDARARLKNVNKVRKSLTSITTSADRARSEVDDMVAGVERCLDQVESLISAAEPEEGGAA